MTPSLNLPVFQFNIQREGKKTKIFDDIRKRFIILTPEEWVRQNIIRFLIEERAFPKGLIAVEKEIIVNQLKKRPDILVYRNNGTPLFMVECKAPEVAISQATFDQAANYNIKLKLPYLMVTNGIQHYCASINFENKSFQFLKQIPHYNELEL